MTNVPVLDVTIIVVCMFSITTVTNADTNRTGRLFNSVLNDNSGLNDIHGSRNDDISRYGLSSPSGFPNLYIDYGLVPFGVNVPPRTYLPPLQWPDYSVGYPPAQRPSPHPPAPAQPPPPAAYLPPRPRPIATTTEFNLPEVIDARKSTPTAITKNIARDPKPSEYDQNRNRWTDTSVHRDVHSAEPVKVTEMQCDRGPEGRLRATLQWNFGGASGFPVFEDSQGGRLGGDGCTLNVEREVPEGEGAKVHVEVLSASFPACGIVDCPGGDRASYLCAHLRFPMMQGLRLADDVVLTLRCRIQEPIAIHTKHFHLPVSSAVAGRSAGVFATGGASNELRCELEVLRRGASQQFSSRLAPGAQVLLGEELLVRLTVADGNGWLHSRLGEVVLGAGGAGGAAGARLALLTAEGCVAAGADAICPQPPHRETALSHSLIIRAPMFDDGTPSGGANVQLSVRVVACRRAQACIARCARASRSLPPALRTDPRMTASDASIYLGRERHLVSYEINSTTLELEGAQRSPINSKGAYDEPHLSKDNVINNMNDANDYEESTKQNLNNAEYYNAKSLNEIRKHVIDDPNFIVDESDISQKVSERVRRKRASVPSAMSADSVASVNFTVILPNANKKGQAITEGVNDKPLAMIIVLAGLVSALIVAVLFVHHYRKREPTINW